MPSLRSSGKIVGDSTSIGELGQRHGLSAPFSMRALFEAMGLPHVSDRGPVQSLRIPLNLVQRKVNEVLGDPNEPALVIVFDELNFEDTDLLDDEEKTNTANQSFFGKNKVSIYLADPSKGGLDLDNDSTIEPFVEDRLPFQEAKLPNSIPIPDIPNPIPGLPDIPIPDIPLPDISFEMSFNDFRTDKISVSLLSEPKGALPEVIANVSAETGGGEEIQLNNAPNFDITRLVMSARSRMRLDAANGLVSLTAESGSIDADISLNIGPIPTEFLLLLGVAGLGIGTAIIKELLEKVVAELAELILEKKLQNAVREALEGKEGKPGVNQRLTRLLLGNDARAVGVWSNGSDLIIDYIVTDQRPAFVEVPQHTIIRDKRWDNIDHIVVLMMENRSFDHMLGYLSRDAGRTDVAGLLQGRDKNFLRGDDGNFLAAPAFEPLQLSNTRIIEDPGHGFGSVAQQLNNGELNGFVADFSERFPDATDKGTVMGYYGAAQVPVYDALAREFVICQKWFSSHPGPTLPNRSYALTGHLNVDRSGAIELNNPRILENGFFRRKTIFDHLSNAGVSWKYYEHGYCTLRLFAKYTFDDVNVVDARDPSRGFFAAARAGQLPAVSFIDPDFIQLPPGNDDHPPSDILDGQRLVAEVVQALIDGPRWDNTLLIITYDEHGGFFDHVKPPVARSVPPTPEVTSFGLRVPTFIVSPWVERGKVNNFQFDHTSILRTIIGRFLPNSPPDMGERVARANNLTSLIRDHIRVDRPVIPLPSVPAPSSSVSGPEWRARLLREGGFHGNLIARRRSFFMP